MAKKYKKKSFSGKTFLVGDLGKVREGTGKNAVTVSFVKEEDGTKSWQLLPDQNSDVILKQKKVIPLEVD